MKQKQTDRVIIPFPIHRAAGARQAPGMPAVKLRHDLLSIANYLETCADDTDYPLWMRSMAAEVRRVIKHS